MAETVPMPWPEANRSSFALLAEWRLSILPSVPFCEKRSSGSLSTVLQGYVWRPTTNVVQVFESSNALDLRAILPVELALCITVELKRQKFSPSLASLPLCVSSKISQKARAQLSDYPAGRPICSSRGAHFSVSNVYHSKSHDNGGLRY